MTVRKSLTKTVTVTPRFLDSIQTEFCKLANIKHIEQKIRNMAKTKLILSEAKKPIMSPALECEIEAALVQYEQMTKWKEWGLDTLRKQGNMVFLGGPPGTGKTTIANYMSKRVGRSMVTLNMKDVGGKAPGHTERMIHETFQGAKAGGLKTIFMDECEAIVWDRGRAGSDSMWMVGIIDEILMQTANYKGLIVAASNRGDIVDTALLDRCFAVLQIGMPEGPERLRLWLQKMPERFPLRLTKIQFDTLSEVAISGRQIENAIVREASMALAQKREPSFTELLNIAKKLSK